jgi:hypothetical protein
MCNARRRSAREQTTPGDRSMSALVKPVMRPAAAVPPATGRWPALSGARSRGRIILGRLVPATIAAGLIATADLGAAEDLPRSGDSFALIGDTPYGSLEVQKLDVVIDEINRSRNVRFVVHTGDVKDGSERCDDELLLRRFQQFQRFQAAFIVTPGDNDWTDCHRSSNGGYLPTERLAKFRQIFYPDPSRTTGQRPAVVQSQSTFSGFETYVENVMWRFNGTTMATVHVVGSANNLAPWNQLDATDTVARPRPDRIAEFRAREAAALAWIDTVFDAATQSDSAGVMIAMQADPRFEIPAGAPARKGFDRILDKLAQRAVAFRRPVLLAHGDSHRYRVDQPLAVPGAPPGSATLKNFTRVENFGSPHVHWLEIVVDPGHPDVFTVIRHMVDANVFER